MSNSPSIRLAEIRLHASRTVHAGADPKFACRRIYGQADQFAGRGLSANLKGRRFYSACLAPRLTDRPGDEPLAAMVNNTANN
jgi:hypothetical protein